MDANSKPKIEREEFVGTSDLLKSKLDPKSCFIIDCFTEIYCWIGRNSQKEIRNIAREFASAIPTKDSRDPWTVVQIVHEGFCLFFLIIFLLLFSFVF
jgi:hypothetical protein